MGDVQVGLTERALADPRYTFEPDPQNRNRLLSSIHGEGWKEGSDYTLIVPTASTTIADIRAQVDQVLKVQQHRKHMYVPLWTCPTCLGRPRND